MHEAFGTLGYKRDSDYTDCISVARDPCGEFCNSFGNCTRIGDSQYVGKTAPFPSDITDNTCHPWTFRLGTECFYDTSGFIHRTWIFCRWFFVGASF